MPGSFILPLLIALPLLGAVLAMVSPKGEHRLARGIGLVFTTATFLVSLLVLRYFNPKSGMMQLVFDAEWIPGLGAHFKTGIDGISLWLVLLTTFMMPITMLGASKAIDRHVREFVASMLVLEAGMLGAFVALDLFLFYVAWEVMLIPMYLLIGIWGGQRRLYASIKFVIYTMVGSLLMLVAIFYVYAQYASVTGVYTTDLDKLSTLALSHDAQLWCFAAFAVAFAIKVPLFPHGAAVLAPVIAVLAVIGIIYGAVVAFAQDDVKKLVAYSSVSHLGFCAVGIFALTNQGVSGSIYAMLSHGLTTGGLFLGIGMLYERRHTRRLREYGGIWQQMPLFSGMFLIITMGSAGLPGLSGFVGEFLTIFGTFIAGDTFPKGWPDYLPAPRLLGALAATGVILGAVYLLYMFQKVFFGPLDKQKNGHLQDLSGRELAVFLPLVLGIFAMGLAPRPILASMEQSVDTFIKSYKNRLAEPDGPAHIYGQPVGGPPAGQITDDAPAGAPGGAAAPAKAAGEGAAAADLKVNLDRLAQAAGAVDTKLAAVGGAP